MAVHRIEIDAGRAGDPGFLEQAGAESHAVVGEMADILSLIHI